ncbi:MAG: outer membrane protein assembly factor BamD [Acidobacteria bacterium]|nr:outer membrane protein assembly factor BamD [Acidobacteriota bacterium]
MTRHRNWIVLAASVGFLFSLGCRHKKYENPIAKDTLQPDKVLFDKAVNDIEKGRYEIARLTLNTLMNTYDTSEFLAKAKLAIADSWYREGGSHGLAQAEAEYKDFILFYPTLEESAEAQEKVCLIHFRQMEKPDRDMAQSLRAEEECRQVLVQFPNSKFAPMAQQKLREIQEVIAEGEFRRGLFYHHKGSNPAASNRLQTLVDQYPLYSNADGALWLAGDSYMKMGPRFRQKAGQAYSRIVKDYPLSDYAEDAKKQLTSLELPIPEADPVAEARMKYEIENRQKAGVMSQALGIFRKNPDVRMAAKSGQPAMTTLRPTTPASVPVPATGGASGVSDVTIGTVNDTTLDTKPDARMNPQSGTTGNPAQATTPPASTPEPAAAAAPAQPLPTNHTAPPVKVKKKKKAKNEAKVDVKTQTQNVSQQK